MLGRVGWLDGGGKGLCPMKPNLHTALWYNHRCRQREKSFVTNVSVETTKLIGSLNSTVTMINETIIGLVVCKSVVHLGGSRTLS